MKKSICMLKCLLVIIIIVVIFLIYHLVRRSSLSILQCCIMRQRCVKTSSRLYPMNLRRLLLQSEVIQNCFLPGWLQMKINKKKSSIRFSIRWEIWAISSVIFSCYQDLIAGICLLKKFLCISRRQWRMFLRIMMQVSWRKIFMFILI